MRPASAVAILSLCALPACAQGRDGVPVRKDTPASAKPSAPPRDSARIGTDTTSCMCTMEFRLIAVRVVGAAGRPVTDARLTVRRLGTGEVIARDAEPSGSESYGLFDDSDKSKIAPDGEDFEVTAVSGARRGSTRLRLGLTPRCHCHIEKLSGSDVIIVR